MSRQGFFGFRHESTRDAQMTMERGLDLNFPPPEQSMDLIDTFMCSNVPEMHAQVRRQLQPQPMNNVQVIDDEISIISPMARKNRLRNRPGPQIMNENMRVHPSYGPTRNEDIEGHGSYGLTRNEDMEVRGSYGQMQLAKNMHVHYGYSERIPVPISTVPYPSDIRKNLQIMETVQEKDVPVSPKEDPPVPASLICPICMSPVSEAMSTKCGHVYCKLCIETAIKDQHKCPTCRRQLKKNDIFKIYLPPFA